MAKGQCSERDSCSFKRDACKNGKARGKRDRPNSPSPGPKVHQKNTSRKAPARPSGKGKQPSCYSYLKGKCTKPSCDYWHPPECVKHKTNGGCKCGDNFAFLHSENGEAPSKKTKIDSNANKATLASVRSFQKFGCVSQDLEPLAAAMCDAEDPCSVNTAYEPESSLTTSPRSTTRPLFFWNCQRF